MRPYDAVLCDIDGVLRHWPSPAELDAAHGLPAGTFASVAFAPARLLPAITGEVTDEQWRAAVAVDLAQRCGSTKVARQLVADWSAMVPAVDPAAVELLRQARRSVTVALITNATSRLDADLARVGLDQVADIVINSSRVGAAKPDPKIYAIAADMVDATPQRCLFIDDTLANVVAAREAGMTAYRHRGLADLRAALAPCL